MGEAAKRSGVLFAVGYGLCKAAGASGYFSAMGLVDGSTGFVTTGDFMFANTIASVLLCALVALAGRRGLRFPRTALAACAYACLAADFLVVPYMESSVIAGAVYGVSSILLSVVWFAACVEMTQEPSIAITSGLVLSLVIQAVVDVLGVAGAPLSTVLLGLSAAVFFAVFRKKGEVDTSTDVPGSLRMGAKATEVFLPALLCLMVCVFVVGASNIAVLGSALQPLFDGVNMRTTNLAAAILAAVVVFCGAAAPNPVKAYAVMLPALFVVFSLIPFAGGGMGSIAGSIMIGCYQAIAVIFAAFSVKFASVERLNPYVIGPLCFGGSSLALLLGLSIGSLLGLLGSRGLPLTVLMMMVAVYPLGLVLLFVTRRRKSASSTNVVSGSVPADDMPRAAGDKVEIAFKRRAAEIAALYGLTKREEEILLYVARGRSARVISEELFISENTTWSHIKRIYAKVGVHSKQAVLDLFEEGIGPQ